MTRHVLDNKLCFPGPFMMHSWILANIMKEVQMRETIIIDERQYYYR